MNQHTTRANRLGRLGLVSALCLASLAGCTHLGPAERQAVIDARQMYDRGDYDGAVAKLDRVIRDYSRAAEIGEAHYIRGLSHAQANRVDPAIKDLEAAAGSSRSDLRSKALVSLGSLHYRMGNYDAAANHYKEGLAGFPNEPPKDKLLYTAGLAAQRAGRWDEATGYYSQALRMFRDRPIAAEARRMALWRHPYHAIQLGIYRDSGNADEAVRDFRARGLDAVQESLPRDGQAVWVVMVGRYRTYADARAALQNVRKIQPEAHVIP